VLALADLIETAGCFESRRYSALASECSAALRLPACTGWQRSVTIANHQHI
jgi:hypothetical protein